MELTLATAVAIGVTLALFWGAFAVTGFWRRGVLAATLALVAAAGYGLWQMVAATGWDALSWFLLAAPALGAALALLAGLGWRAVADRVAGLAAPWPRALGGLAVYAVVLGSFAALLAQM